jgi:hypothetical protein
METIETSKINDRFKQLLGFLTILSDSIDKDAELLRAIQSKVIALKANQPDLKPADAREVMLQAGEVSLNLSLKEQELTRYIHKVIEIYDFLTISGIKPEMTEDEDANFKILLQNSKSLFAIDELQKSVQIADLSLYDIIKKQSQVLNLTDEQIMINLNSPFFTAK